LLKVYFKKVTEISSKTAKKVSTVPKTEHFKKVSTLPITLLIKYRGTAHLCKQLVDRHKRYRIYVENTKSLYTVL